MLTKQTALFSSQELSCSALQAVDCGAAGVVVEAVVEGVVLGVVDGVVDGVVLGVVEAVVVVVVVVLLVVVIGQVGVTVFVFVEVDPGTYVVT